MLHLRDLVEERLHGSDELLEAGAGAKAALVPLGGVPFDSDRVVLGLLDAPRDLIAEAMAVCREDLAGQARGIALELLDRLRPWTAMEIAP